MQDVSDLQKISCDNPEVLGVMTSKTNIDPSKLFVCFGHESSKH